MDLRRRGSSCIPGTRCRLSSETWWLTRLLGRPSSWGWRPWLPLKALPVPRTAAQARLPSFCQACRWLSWTMPGDRCRPWLRCACGLVVHYSAAAPALWLPAVGAATAAQVHVRHAMPFLALSPLLQSITLPSAAAPPLTCTSPQYRATRELAALHQLGNSAWDAMFGRVMPQVG